MGHGCERREVGFLVILDHSKDNAGLLPVGMEGLRNLDVKIPWCHLRQVRQVNVLLSLHSATVFYYHALTHHAPDCLLFARRNTLATVLLMKVLIFD